MPLYLGNYAADMDYENVRDNGYEDGVETLAHPSGFILTSLNHVQTLLDMAWEDWQYGDDEPQPDWQTDGWRAGPEGKRGHQRWTSAHFNGLVIVREAEPLEPTGGPA